MAMARIKRRFQRFVVAAVTQGILPMQKTGTQEIILSNQDKGGIGFARLVDDWLKNSRRSKKGRRRGECVNPSESLPAAACNGVLSFAWFSSWR
jgi:hypothetical protein